MISPRTVLPEPAVIRRPSVSAGASAPLSWISGAPLQPGCDVPLMSTVSRISGSWDSGLMVATPLPRSNAIVSEPGCALASWSAARSVHLAFASGSVVSLQMLLPSCRSGRSPVLSTV